MLLNATYLLTSHPELLSADAETRDALLDRWDDPAGKPAALIALERAGAVTLAAEYPAVSFRQVQVMFTVEQIPRLTESGIVETQARADPVILRPMPVPTVAGWGL